MRREQPAQNRPATLRFILDNLVWMVGALALAILVWYAAVSAQNPVEQRRFPGRIPIHVVTDIQPPEVTYDLAKRSDKLVSIDVIRISEPPPGLTSVPKLSVKEARISG